MNREKAKELADILTAYANGADLQYEAHNEWIDMKDGDAIVFCIEHGREMRVKPKHNENFYRPFKDYEELITIWSRKIGIGYMVLKVSRPVIWLKAKDDTISMITDFKQIKLEDELLCSCVTLDGDNYNMQELLESYTFLDDEPCGVMEK